MNTYKRDVQIMPTEAVFGTLLTFSLGAMIGFVMGQQISIPMSCQTHMLRAHFLDRYVAYEGLLQRSASSEVLHAAAPETELTSSEHSSARTASSAVSMADVPHQEIPSRTTGVIESSASSAIAASASASSVSSMPPDFPAFGRAVYPVGHTPNWGAMKTPAEWNREYDEMNRDDFVRLPAYTMDDLTTPMSELLVDRDNPQHVRMLTAKLFYSTRFFGSYHLDSGEFTDTHAGIDLKLPKGTPIGAIAGGRVSVVAREKSGLGNHIIIEHRVDNETFYSIYGHLSSMNVRENQDITPGELLGTVGSTGRSTGNHLHVQVDRGVPGALHHEVYAPNDTPTRTDANRHTINPFEFIATHAQR